MPALSTRTQPSYIAVYLRSIRWELCYSQCAEAIVHLIFINGSVLRWFCHYDPHFIEVGKLRHRQIKLLSVVAWEASQEDCKFKAWSKALMTY